MTDKIVEPHVNQEKLTKYIKQMRFKKAMNGFNCSDVLKTIEDIQYIFQDYIVQYEKILGEKDAYISELSSRIQNARKNYRQELSDQNSIINDLKVRLDEKTETTIKLNQELMKHKERDRKSGIANKNIQQAHITARLIIEQAKINAELEALKLQERQHAEKEKYKKWKLHTEGINNEVLDNIKQMEKYILRLNDQLTDNTMVEKE